MGEAAQPADIPKLEHNQFASGRLVGASAVIDDDLDFKTPFPVAAVKKISEEKEIAGELKNGAHFKFVCAVTPVIGSNDYPQVADTGFSFTRRANVIPLTRKYHYAEDIQVLKDEGHDVTGLALADLTLPGKLDAEMPGILNVLIKASGVVVKRSGMAAPPACRVALQAWVEAADSVAAFLASEYVENGIEVPMRDFRYAYTNWCRGNGLKAKGSRKITAAVRALGHTVRILDGSQVLVGRRLVSFPPGGGFDFNDN